MLEKSLTLEILKEYKSIQHRQRLEFEQRQAEVYSKIPEIFEIDNQLSATGLSAVNFVMSNSEKADECMRRLKVKHTELLEKKSQLLCKNGYAKNYLTVWHICKICEDTGYINSNKCDCFKAKQSSRLCERSTLSAVLKNQTFDTFDLNKYSEKINVSRKISPKANMERILQACINFVYDFGCGENLLFSGGRGLGKTFLSSCISRDLINKGIDVLYDSAFKIFSVFEDYKFGKGNAAELQSLINRYYNTDMLIIDDLGTEFITSYTVSAMYDLINSRVLANKSTIVSTNMSISDITDTYSDRLSSRFVGHYTHKFFFGDDVRRKNAGL